MGVGGAGIGLLIGMIFAVVFMSPKAPVVVPTAAVQPAPTSTATGTGTGDAAPKVAPSGEQFKQTLRLAAVKDTPFGDLKFVDTSKDTANKPAFGLESESLNQRIIFVIWPDARIQASVDNNMPQPPFIPVKTAQITGTKDAASGSLPFRDFYYRVHHYNNATDKDTMAFVAAYTSNEPDKSVLIVAMPLKGEGPLDYMNTINVIQRMINIGGDTAGNAGGNSGSASSPAVATAEDIQAYRQKVGDIIKAAYKNPADADRASSKCQVKFVIDSSGNISKLELKYTAGMDEVDKAVQKAITANVPFPPPPAGSKGAQAEMLVTLEPGASELTISEP
jgi:TonB family protein